MFLSDLIGRTIGYIENGRIVEMGSMRDFVLDNSDKISVTELEVLTNLRPLEGMEIRDLSIIRVK